MIKQLVVLFLSWYNETKLVSRHLFVYQLVLLTEGTPEFACLGVLILLGCGDSHIVSLPLPALSILVARSLNLELRVIEKRPSTYTKNLTLLRDQKPRTNEKSKKQTQVENHCGALEYRKKWKRFLAMRKTDLLPGFDAVDIVVVSMKFDFGSKSIKAERG
ncbi:hypothetical protein IEQ34_018375 [Dendrobium chrysotoxum]|uniref:Uncharacterized protein n=1 Tax=Dendrobium chrysotoxum TaxID=161865 RepID=A0AAV7GC52_DENCH|nr:hypothetical protein IEQ34_018375 [Dendrobium chrysotoxum]